MRTIIACICLALLLTAPAFAQGGYPLPENLQSITPENAAQLAPLASVGEILPGALAWSPDGSLLAVGTSAETRLYSADALDAPLHTLHAGKQIAFNDAGELLIDDQRWNVETSEFLSAIEPSPPPPSQDAITNEITHTDAQTIITLTRPTGETTTLTIEGLYNLDRIVYSPDEAYAALVLRYYVDGYPVLLVQLWNIETGTWIASMPQVLEILVLITFHGDGNLLIVATTTDAIYGNIFEDIQIWDGRTGQRHGPHNSGFFPLKLSPDGQLLAFLTWEGISIWTDHELGVINVPLPGAGSAKFIFNPDSSTLVYASEQQVTFWAMNSEQLPDQPYVTLQMEAALQSLLYNPDGSLLVTIEQGGIIEIWDANKGELHHRLSASATPYNVQFSLDGHLLRAEVFVDAEVVVWDVATGEKRFELPIAAVWTTDWSKAAYWVSGSLHITDTVTGQDIVLPIIENYMGAVVGFNSSSGWALFSDAGLVAYNLLTGEQVFSQRAAPENSLSVQFNASGSHLMTIERPTFFGYSDPSTINIWSTGNPQQPVSSFQLDGGSSLLLSPDAQFLSRLDGACGDGGGGVQQLFETQQGELVQQIYPGGLCGPYAHVFTPDGVWLIVGWYSELMLLDIAEIARGDTANGVKMPLIYSPRVQIENVTLSPDGQMLALHLTTTVPADPLTAPQSEYWLDLYSFTDLPLAGTDSDTLRQSAIRIPGARKAFFSPNSQYLLSDNGFWDTATGAQLAPISANIAAFSPDGTVLATADTEIVMLWDVATLASGNTVPLATFEVFDTRSLGFNPEGTLLYIQRAGEVAAWGVAVSSE